MRFVRSITHVCPTRFWLWNIPFTGILTVTVKLMCKILFVNDSKNCTITIKTAIHIQFNVDEKRKLYTFCMGVKEKNVCVFLRKINQETAFLFEPKEFMSLNNLTCHHSITWLSVLWGNSGDMLFEWTKGKGQIYWTSCRVVKCPMPIPWFMLYSSGINNINLEKIMFKDVCEGFSNIHQPINE